MNMDAEGNVSEVSNKTLLELARDYREAKDAADAARESVRPAAKVAKDAKAALMVALKEAGGPVVVDDRLYRIQSNGHLAEDDVRVLVGPQ